MRPVLLVASLLAVPGILRQAPPQAGSPPAASDRGMLAVVRRDGLMLPFAAYHGSRWSMPWPTTRAMRGVTFEMPPQLSAIPESWWGGAAPASWRLHLPDGATTVVKPSGLRAISIFCETRVALATDHAPGGPLPSPPPNPFPKDGLAISSDLEVLPIEGVDPQSADAGTLLNTMHDELNKAEDQTIGLIRNVAGWKHPLGAESRHTLPVVLEAWYRSPLDEPGWTADYIEAARPYAPGPKDEGCGLVTFFSGWVLQNAAEPGKPRMKLTARVTYCDRRGVTYMLPFGRIRIGGRQHWVYQLSGFEQEWYEVAHVAKDGVDFPVEFPAGAGDRCGA